MIIKKEYLIYGGFFEVDEKEKKLNLLENKIYNNNTKFWENNNLYKKEISEISLIKKEINSVKTLYEKINELNIFYEFFNEKNFDIEKNLDLLKEALEIKSYIKNNLFYIEKKYFLQSPYDKNNAILNIYPGVGGKDSYDWSYMLLKMYIKWAKINNFQTEIQDIKFVYNNKGILKATVRIIGENAYGTIKSERGVHRLVRISPFNTNKKRHTSFCGIDIIPEIDDNLINFSVLEKDIKIDTFKSSGSGGQHVNTTESAVRITHIPTNITVNCQNERSQHKNKEIAMKILKSRIYAIEKDKQKSSINKFYGKKGEISWGNQIRNYILDPYKMVKDLRTNLKSYNFDSIMQGNINLFIEAYKKL